MQGIKEHILVKSADLKKEVIILGRHFHQHPELSYEETEMLKLHTSDFDIDEDGLETGVANLSWLV